MNPRELGLGLTILRVVREWTQAELAQIAGLAASAVSNYERGETVPSPSTLDRLLRALGHNTSGLERAVSLARFLRGESPSGLSTALDPLLEASLSSWRDPAAAPDPSERRHAPELLARLLVYPAGTRLTLVQESTEFRTWALCELLCHESAKTAAHSGIDARELAELALLVAELTPIEDVPFVSRLQGYAWAFVGNARRVQGDLPGANEAFTRSRELWQVGAGSNAADMLEEVRLLDLEASLRREQRRLAEALALLDQALALAQSSEEKTRILVIVAKTQEELGEHEEAVATLRRATIQITSRQDPRLLLCIRFNLVVNLCGLGRYMEAEACLPSARELAKDLGNELDLVRLRWLEAKIEAGQGRVENAELAFREVAGEFAKRGIGYDAALVLLELAVLLADEERNEDVRELAGLMAPLFKLQEVDRELLATLQLVVRAAEKDLLTAELARRFLDEQVQRKGPERGDEMFFGLGNSDTEPGKTQDAR